MIITDSYRRGAVAEEPAESPKFKIQTFPSQSVLPHYYLLHKVSNASLENGKKLVAGNWCSAAALYRSGW